MVNKNDKRYLKTKAEMEKNYFRQVRKNQGMTSVTSRSIYRGAKVHPTTFARHYQNLRGMVKAVRSEVKTDYAKMLKRMTGHNAAMKDVAIATLEYMKKHKQYFRAAAEANNVVIFEWMGRRLWRRVRKTRYQYGMRRMEKVYAYEVMGILIAWVKDEKFDEKKIDQYANYVVRVGDGGASRLSFLADKE